jgi:hypothetical protein
MRELAKRTRTEFLLHRELWPAHRRLWFATESVADQILLILVAGLILSLLAGSWIYSLDKRPNSLVIFMTIPQRPYVQRLQAVFVLAARSGSRYHMSDAILLEECFDPAGKYFVTITEALEKRPLLAAPTPSHGVERRQCLQLPSLLPIQATAS